MGIPSVSASPPFKLHEKNTWFLVNNILVDGNIDSKKDINNSTYSEAERLSRILLDLFPIFTFATDDKQQEFLEFSFHRHELLNSFTLYDSSEKNEGQYHLGCIIIIQKKTQKIHHHIGLYQNDDFRPLKNSEDLKFLNRTLQLTLPTTTDNQKHLKVKEYTALVLILNNINFDFSRLSTPSFNLQKQLWEITVAIPFKKTEFEIQIDMTLDGNYRFQFPKQFEQYDEYPDIYNATPLFSPLLRFEPPPFKIQWSIYQSGQDRTIEFETIDKKLTSFFKTDEAHAYQAIQDYETACNIIHEKSHLHYVIREGNLPFFEYIQLIEISFYSGSLIGSQIYLLSDLNEVFIPITGDLGAVLMAIDQEFHLEKNTPSEEKDIKNFKDKLLNDKWMTFQFLSLWGWATARFYIFDSIIANLPLSKELKNDSDSQWNQDDIKLINHIELKKDQSECTHKIHQDTKDNIHKNKIEITLDHWHEDNGKTTIIRLKGINVVRWQYIKTLSFRIVFYDPERDGTKIEVLEKIQENHKHELPIERLDITPFGSVLKPLPIHLKRELYHYLGQKIPKEIAQCFSRNLGNQGESHLTAEVAKVFLNKDQRLSDVHIMDEFVFWSNFEIEKKGAITLTFQFCTFEKMFKIPEHADTCSLVFIDCHFEEGFWSPSAKIQGSVIFIRCYFGFDKKLPQDNDNKQFQFPSIAAADFSVYLSHSIIKGTLTFNQCTFSGRLALNSIQVSQHLRIRGCWLGKRINSIRYHPMPVVRMSELFDLKQTEQKIKILEKYYTHHLHDEDVKYFYRPPNINHNVDISLYKEIMNNDWKQENVPGITMEDSIIDGDLELCASCDEFHDEANIEESYKVMHSRGTLLGYASYICGNIQASGIEVQGSCFFTGLYCTGNVEFNFSTVHGNVLLFSRSAFRHHRLIFPHCYVQGNLRFEDCDLKGYLNFTYSYINGNLSFIATQLRGDLHISGTFIGKDLLLNSLSTSGQITAYPRLDLNQLNLYGVNAWRSQTAKPNKLHPDSPSTTYKLINLIMPYLCRPLCIQGNIELSGTSAYKVEFRGIEVKGKIEAITGNFSRFLIGHGLLFVIELKNKSIKSRFLLKPSVSTRIRLRSLKIEDTVDLSGVILVKHTRTHGSSLRLTHSEIGGDVRFNNEYLITDLFSCFPDLRAYSKVDLKQETTDLDSNAKTDKGLTALFFPKYKRGDFYEAEDNDGYTEYFHYLPSFNSIKPDKNLNEHLYPFKYLESSNFIEHQLWHDLKENPHNQERKNELIFISGIYEKNSRKIYPSKINIDRNLYLYANNISGRMDIRNVYIKGKIFLNDSQIKRQCVLSSNISMENELYISDKFKTRCTGLMMDRLHSSGTIDLTGVLQINQHSHETKLQLFMNAVNLKTDADLLFFRPSIHPNDDYPDTGIAYIDGGVMLDGVNANRIAISHLNFFKDSNQDKHGKRRLSMNHININEFQLDDKLHSRVSVLMSESNITKWNFVKLEKYLKKKDK